MLPRRHLMASEVRSSQEITQEAFQRALESVAAEYASVWNQCQAAHLENSRLTSLLENRTVENSSNHSAEENVLREHPDIKCPEEQGGFNAPSIFLTAVEGAPKQIECFPGCQTDVTSREQAPELRSEKSRLAKQGSTKSSKSPRAGKAGKALSATLRQEERIKIALGKTHWDSNLSATRLHDVIFCLGLVRYAVEDLDDMMIAMNALNGSSQTHVIREPSGEGSRSTGGSRFLSVKAAFNEVLFSSTDSSGSTGSGSNATDGRKSQSNDRKSQSNDRKSQKKGLKDHSSTSSIFADDTGISVTFELFIDVLLIESLHEQLSPEHHKMAMAIKDVLLDGGANTLIGELMNVRLNDMTNPRDSVPVDDYMEPVVAFAIVVNGILMGVQADVKLESWPGWRWVSLVFTLFFFMEMLVRIYTKQFRGHFFGEDCLWNGFDALVVAIAIVDSCIAFIYSELEISSLTLFRTIRLTRLTRLLRLLRMTALQELNLMVRGLLHGFRTLFFAAMLLFFMVYIVAVCTTQMLGNQDRIEIIASDELFTSVPRSMFTSFRCFTGDCTTSTGEPIAQLLGQTYGLAFILAYIASTIIVVFGLFNLIMAIYVECTMSAAKRVDEFNVRQRERESLRVANLAKQLLMKFWTAQSLLDCEAVGDAEEFTQRMSVQSLESETMKFEGVYGETAITRELFLITLQDREVQQILDELDVPPNRAQLFDVLDANQDGTLSVEELVRNLLLVCGEARRSDQIACLLAVRALHAKVDRISNTQSMTTSRPLHASIASIACLDPISEKQ